MNPDISVFSKEIIDELDHVALPWAVEALEDQGLLALKVKVAIVKKGRSAQLRGPIIFPAALFECWCDDDNDDAHDMDVCDDDSGSDEASGDGSSTSVCDQEEASDDDDSSQKSNDSQSSRKRTREVGDWDDSDVDDDASEFDFENEDFFEKCAENPLDETATFRYAKVRTVSLSPELDTSGLPTCNYFFTCSCGFPIREGVSCRHILAVVFLMLSVTQGADNDQIDMSHIKLSGLLDMSLCDKVKYHAILHDQGDHFPSNNTHFKPLIERNIAIEYLSQASVDPDRISHKSGLPEQQHFEEFVEVQKHLTSARFLW
jgi:hypothetical protein